jgi:hypothetical protein
VSANLLSLKFYPWDGGQTQCASNNNGKIWRQDISAGGSLHASREYRYDQLNRFYAAGECTSATFTPAYSDPNAVWSQQFKSSNSNCHLRDGWKSERLALELVAGAEDAHGAVF